jgi:hypothetical protein
MAKKEGSCFNCKILDLGNMPIYCALKEGKNTPSDVIHCGHYIPKKKIITEPKTMGVFWKWMEEKGYGYEGMHIKTLDHKNKFPIHHYVEIPKQMLIGYMIEYLIERDVIDVSHFFDGPFFLNSIDSVYQYIVDEVMNK